MTPRSVVVPFRLAKAPARPLDISLTPEEYDSLSEAAGYSELPVGSYVRAVLTEVFGEEKTKEILSLHASEIGLPVAVLVRELVLSASGFPASSELETYKDLARKAGRKLAR